MPDAARTVQRTYLVLTLFNTLAASFIWGINTLFLLDAGLDNTQAFTVNAFFTVGQVLFEVPTGVVADTRGRQFSFLLGAAHAARGDPAVPGHVAGPRRPPGLGGRLDPARARVHLLLRRDRGVAGGRPQRDRVPGDPRVGLRPGAGRERRGHADRLGPRRLRRPGDQPRRAVPDPGGAARRDLPDRLAVHARHRVHAAARRERPLPRSGRCCAARSTAACATRRSAG